MSMTAKDINTKLNDHFIRYDYRLNNTVVFNWESDWLCQSSGGYWVEGEVKISRGDFFRDFDKPKHRFFQSVRQARTHFVQDLGHTRGDLICEYEHGELTEGRCRRSRPVMHNGKMGYWVNEQDEIDHYIYHRQERIYSQATWIRIEEMTKIRCPHQFYFVVPEKLVRLEEVPDYAGLIYVGEYLEVIRRAPYLHKTKMDLTKTLLKKYYNLWTYGNYNRDQKYQMCLDIRALI